MLQERPDASGFGMCGRSLDLGARRVDHAHQAEKDQLALDAVIHSVGGVSFGIVRQHPRRHAQRTQCRARQLLVGRLDHRAALRCERAQVGTKFRCYSHSSLD
jgi:hypothetical protein